MWLCDIEVWKTALGTELIILAGGRESPVPGHGSCVSGKLERVRQRGQDWICVWLGTTKSQGSGVFFRIPHPV